MKRLYEDVIIEDLAKLRQMVFIMGPRQVGKTTTSLHTLKKGPNHHYLNWDNESHRRVILEGVEAVARYCHLEALSEEPPILIFDEIHKYKRWKVFLKGFFDTYGRKVKILVTGSARLDIFQRGGDSLMGRYFPYHLHPLSVGEILHPHFSELEIHPLPQKIPDRDFERLIRYGGFPEPYIKNQARFYTRWKKTRRQQLFQEDLRDITQIQSISQIQLLSDLLVEQIGQLTKYSELAKKVNVSVDTIRRWIKVLESIYFTFTIKPWSKNITRSLIKEPKYYLWDWALVSDQGARLENLIASHLLKAVHFWTDVGFGDYDLFFIRDKEKREVDFLVTKDQKPWFLVEVKSSSNSGISPHLYTFQKQTGAKHAFQVVFNMPFVKKSCFSETKPTIVPASTFLSQLI